MWVYIARTLTWKISRVTPLKLMCILKNSGWKKPCPWFLKSAFVLWRFLYFQHRLQMTLKHNIWNISGSESVIKNCGHGFLVLFVIIYWSQKEQQQQWQKWSPPLFKAHCWSKRLENFTQILPNSVECPNHNA